MMTAEAIAWTYHRDKNDKKTYVILTQTTKRYDVELMIMKFGQNTKR